jgi:DNA-binding LacI/PurR family transcriptional regulator
MVPDRPFNLQRRERLMTELRLHGAVRVRDLAPLLGVSELTVRRDLTVLAEQRLLTKVHGGAVLPARLGPAVRRRRAGRARFTIGMVVPSLDFYWPPIVAGARAAAAVLGSTIQLRGSSYDPAEDRRQIMRLVDAGQVQGLLLAPALGGPVLDGRTGPGRADDEVIDWIGRLPVPAILVERQPPRWTQTPHQLEWVRSDHFLGIEMAVRHLHQQGHRRIGLILSQESPTSIHLGRGWTLACADLGLPDDIVFHESVRLEAPGRRDLVADILRRCTRSATTALVVHSDPDAMAVAQLCGEQGLTIPGDLALVSYDDEVAHLAEPALTAIRPHKEHVGRVAVELMVARLLEGRHRPVQRVLVAPELMIRDSSVPVVRPSRK